MVIAVLNDYSLVPCRTLDEADARILASRAVEVGRIWEVSDQLDYRDNLAGSRCRELAAPATSQDTRAGEIQHEGR
jgi:hypothetical protein